VGELRKCTGHDSELTVHQEDHHTIVLTIQFNTCIMMHVVAPNKVTK